MSSKNEAKQELSKLTPDEAYEIRLQLREIFKDPKRVSELSQRLLKLGKLEDKESQQQIDWTLRAFKSEFEVEWLPLLEGGKYIISHMLQVLSSRDPLKSWDPVYVVDGDILLGISDVRSAKDAEERLLLRSCLMNYLQLVFDHYKVAVKQLHLSTVIDSTSGGDEWFEIFEFLIKRCTDLNMPIAPDKDFLWTAAIHASPRIFQLFLENGARPIQPIDPGCLDSLLMIADYQEKPRTLAMGDLEALIQEAQAASEALSQDNLLINPLINIVVGYLPRNSDDAKGQPDKTPVHYPTWVEEQLKKLTALIPTKENPSDDIKAIKDAVIEVLGNPFLKEQCEIYWKDLQIARQEGKGRSLDDVLPPRKKIANASTAAPTIQGKQDDKGSPVGNRSAFSFSSTHTTTDRSKGSDISSGTPAQVQESSGRKKSF